MFFSDFILFQNFQTQILSLASYFGYFWLLFCFIIIIVIFVIIIIIDEENIVI